MEVINHEKRWCLFASRFTCLNRHTYLCKLSARKSIKDIKAFSQQVKMEVASHQTRTIWLLLLVATVQSLWEFFMSTSLSRFYIRFKQFWTESKHNTKLLTKMNMTESFNWQTCLNNCVILSKLFFVHLLPVV